MPWKDRRRANWGVFNRPIRGVYARRSQGGRTDRAARRLFDRLTTLGIARELTGRTNFRLYGLERAKSAARSAPFDAELADLSEPLRWRDWMGRVEAAIFAAREPVPRETLAALVGTRCNLDALMDDIAAELRLKRLSLRDGALRAPEPRAPFAYVTTRKFLEAFGVACLRELPDFDRLEGRAAPADGVRGRARRCARCRRRRS